MTVDDAIAISRAHVSALWKRCDRAAGETPETLREQALEVLADEVERLRTIIHGVVEAAHWGVTLLVAMVLL